MTIKLQHHFRRYYGKLSSIRFEFENRLYSLEKQSSGDNKHNKLKILDNGYFYLISSSYEDACKKILHLEDLRSDFNRSTYKTLLFNAFKSSNGNFERSLGVIISNPVFEQNISNSQLMKFKVENGLLKLLHVKDDPNNVKEGGTDKDIVYRIADYEGHHPIFDSVDYRPVFDNIEYALKILKQVPISNQIDNVVANQIIGIEKDKLTDVDDTCKRYPFVVVEGLDGTGKSTMVRNLSKYLDAVPLGTPPKSISSMRKEFDALPELLRRSYYAFGNYLAAQEVMHRTMNRPVVMDRYWHSTTAYAMAKEVGSGPVDYLPRKGHPIYKWPMDLLVPTAVVFLKTSEAERDERLIERTEMTIEEQKLRNNNFRKRVNQVYRMINTPAWIEVDTSGTQEQSLKLATDGLKDHGII